MRKWRLNVFCIKVHSHIHIEIQVSKPYWNPFVYMTSCALFEIVWKRIDDVLK